MPSTPRLLTLLAAVSWPALLHAQTPPTQAGALAAATVPVPTEAITVVSTSPLLGVGIDRDKVPGETTVLGSADLAREGTPNLTQALNEQVGAISLSAASGNPFQPD